MISERGIRNLTMANNCVRNFTDRVIFFSIQHAGTAIFQYAGKKCNDWQHFGRHLL